MSYKPLFLWNTCKTGLTAVKNMKINKELIDETRSGVFDYFALGHDDTSQLSQSALEGRYLNKYSKDIPAEKIR